MLLDVEVTNEVAFCRLEAERMVLKECGDVRYTAAVITFTTIAMFIDSLPKAEILLDEKGRGRVVLI